MKELLDFRNYLIESEKSELTVEKYLREEDVVTVSSFSRSNSKLPVWVRSYSSLSISAAVSA